MHYVKMIPLSPPWGSSKTIKTNTCFFFENCKKNLYCFVEFLSKSKILHAMLIRGAPIKKRGFVPIFL